MHRLQISAELIPDPNNGGYTVYCPEFDVMSQGDDPDEAIANLREAVKGYIKTIGIKQAFKEYRKPIRESIEVTV
ncbi:MAG: type II toxin-antitoxin system HicB family antitoxin [Candidatus Omnitrophica bacterium]|nr:type II toxin-antitoxin system HicB family antitoxin [Candidatus Omnitrophota bacterium]MBU1932313.1 type II toxin-antitoxin system HicB family antitoxin [Candidatus Omnitrophota bacterium]